MAWLCTPKLPSSAPSVLQGSAMVSRLETCIGGRLQQPCRLHRIIGAQWDPCSAVDSTKEPTQPTQDAQGIPYAHTYSAVDSTRKPTQPKQGPIRSWVLAASLLRASVNHHNHHQTNTYVRITTNCVTRGKNRSECLLTNEWRSLIRKDSAKPYAFASVI